MNTVDQILKSLLKTSNGMLLFAIVFFSKIAIPVEPAPKNLFFILVSEENPVEQIKFKSITLFSNKAEADGDAKRFYTSLKIKLDGTFFGKNKRLFLGGKPVNLQDKGAFSETLIAELNEEQLSIPIFSRGKQKKDYQEAVLKISVSSEILAPLEMGKEKEAFYLLGPAKAPELEPEPEPEPIQIQPTPTPEPEKTVTAVETPVPEKASPPEEVEPEPILYEALWFNHIQLGASALLPTTGGNSISPFVRWSPRHVIRPGLWARADLGFALHKWNATTRFFQIEIGAKGMYRISPVIIALGPSFYYRLDFKSYHLAISAEIALPLTYQRFGISIENILVGHSLIFQTASKIHHLHLGFSFSL